MRRRYRGALYPSEQQEALLPRLGKCRLACPARLARAARSGAWTSPCRVTLEPSHADATTINAIRAGSTSIAVLISHEAVTTAAPPPFHPDRQTQAELCRVARQR